VKSSETRRSRNSPSSDGQAKPLHRAAAACRPAAAADVKHYAEKNTMKKVPAAVFIPSVRGLVRGLRFCAAAVALHGMVLGLTAAVQSLFSSVSQGSSSELIGDVVFWVLAVPALLLTRPFISILWNFGLMNAPGWFAWPKPLGIALAYLVWVVVLLGLAQVVRRWFLKKQSNSPTMHSS